MLEILNYSQKLLQKYPIISDQVSRDGLTVILSELEDTLKESQDGSIVEFGCYAGTTSLFIQRLIALYDLAIEFHVYDSFEGLPNKSSYDASPAGMQFKPGELSYSKKQYIQNFKKAGVQTPYIHKAWFKDLNHHDVPPLIRFAFLDGDYYDSVLTPLRLIENNLVDGAVIIVDDYMNEALPGAKKAVDEWIAGQSGCAIHHEKSLAIIHYR